VLAIPAIALADTISADPVVNTVVVENNVSKAAGESGTVKVWLANDDNATDPVNGCNANTSNPVSITLSSNNSDITFDSSGTKANPASLTNCGSLNGKEIGYTVKSTATGPFPKTATVTASGSGGRVTTSGGTTNQPLYTPDTFTVTITAPLDSTAPNTTIDSNPAALTNSTSASFAFSSNETGSTFECKLDGGTFAACTSPKSLTGLSEGSHTFSVRATDGAGNVDATPATYTWNVDTTAPVVTATPDRSADQNGWYNQALTVSFSGSDASGIASCSPDANYSGPDSGTASVNGSCTDNAGNSDDDTFNFKYDGTAPTNVSGAPARAADHNGWYTSSVNIDFNGNDATSGIDSCTSSTYSGPDGTNLTVNGTCTDEAGNQSNPVASSAFNYDATAPSTTASPDRSADQNGWYNHAVTVSFSGNDATSGIAGCDAAVNYSGPDSGTASVNGSCTDNAGNSDDDTFNFKYDATAPVVTLGAATGTAGSNGWYTSAVSQTFNASDATSGLPAGFTTPFSVSSSGEGSTVSINSGAVTDNAGNTNNGIPAGPFKIDLSDPTNVQFVGGPAAGGSYDFGDAPAEPTCKADDAISGVEKCAVTGYSTLVGTHTMTATATDNAGRTATAQRTYTIKPYTFNGFYQPVDMSTATTTVWNTIKGGSTVPLKFELFKGTTELTDTSAIKSLQAQKVSCSTGAAGVEDAIETVATGGTSLRYDSTGGQYIYNWKTPTGANTCYKVTLTAQDGSTLSAYFKIK